ncbi:DUF6227 family protein [Streptomyces montanisoli]|uniref:Uncharacterized protein n=1 Tax=Streptomyces montanisoli TaxID=2798581 RepID=A0A940RXF1_9ACTN|nr:DUF6227 family protein [Streptomyces montanisoli]MBP0460510.1 hypothetical protein [Streptomyces montanisoli]
MNGPYETTEAHIQRLLERSLNSFALPAALVGRLDSALAHASSLSSAYHSKGRHRETYRHTFLLSDGSALTLWEVVHTTGHDGTPLYELFAAEADAREASTRLLDGEGRSGRIDFDGPDFGVRISPGEVLAASAAALPRLYVSDNSPDHARRVLRRAENADRPGEETARRLRTAFAHHIAQVFGHWCHPAERNAGFMLYEHAFLLIDGTETSLWEVEHTATPDGRHMCEVYADELAARTALDLRTRVR